LGDDVDIPDRGCTNESFRLEKARAAAHALQMRI
jgi:hypothetical protein